MSGFERSAPVPGSQGPRRSQMVRYNNAPPPMSPWRQEVLEAQKQLQGHKAEKRERSRSRSPRKKPEKRTDKAPIVESEPDLQTAAQAAVKGGKSPAMLPPEKTPILRKAKEHGEGWFAALAHAAQSWEPVGKTRSESSSKKAPVVMTSLQDKETSKERTKDKPKERERDGKEKEKEIEKDDEGERRRKQSEPLRDTRVEAGHDKESDESLRRKQQALERKRLEEAEARERKVVEEKRVAEEQRKKREEMEKQRRKKLAGAFAVGDDDDDEAQREAVRMRQAAERRRESLEVVPRILEASISSISTPRSIPVDPAKEEFRLEPGLTAADAFMRLQERKRKGRRAEFGGPPRDCSPWRDGRRHSSPPRR
mmetsp:Transcript_16260/g.37508  ORF Transcript_16260/g.37508 Transcript_16260/m.37508 type:complete len:368 (-) Transcript_16260:122-1225(-)